MSGKSTITSRKETENTRNVQKDQKIREKLSHVKTGLNLARWVPNRSGVTANREADFLAKAGDESTLIPQKSEDSSHAEVAIIS